MTEASRREAWDRATSTPLVVLGVAFIVAYSWFVLAPGAPTWLSIVLAAVFVLTWVVFVVDLVVRIALTPRGERVKYVVTHPIELLSTAVPVFRAIRVVELFRHIPYLERRTGAAVRTRFVLTAVAYAVVFVYFIALATLNAERGRPGATIENFGDAIWWACVTIATVGYGDLVPVTVAGRIYAVLLMIGGVAIVGTASATFVSVLSDRIARLREHEHEHEHEHDREHDRPETSDPPKAEDPR
ncbi:hypothetical protein ET445_15395 [Agromyces protaetiae]|uniref:Potassium channel domain-containing protein n=1 Tax=Agromyces protaetiae TaxID=2509455 RepID=A0A4P6FF75_9MICO|nr:potassium channel family protein [Agromyces protaetiae]QAY74506.1 hypothetical protein ET445_15395 [Agromyces protaetiae]